MGAEQAVALFYDKDIKDSKNPEEFRAARIEEYTRQYADSFATRLRCYLCSGYHRTSGKQGAVSPGRFVCWKPKLEGDSQMAWEYSYVVLS